MGPAIVGRQGGEVGVSVAGARILFGGAPCGEVGVDLFLSGQT